MIANKGHPFHAATSLGLITFPPEPFSLLKVCQLSTYAISTACFLYFLKHDIIRFTSVYLVQLKWANPVPGRGGSTQQRDSSLSSPRNVKEVLHTLFHTAIARPCKEQHPSSNTSVLIAVDLLFFPLFMWQGPLFPGSTSLL